MTDQMRLQEAIKTLHYYLSIYWVFLIPLIVTVVFRLWRYSEDLRGSIFGFIMTSIIITGGIEFIDIMFMIPDSEKEPVFLTISVCIFSIIINVAMLFGDLMMGYHKRIEAGDFDNINDHE